MRDRDKEFDLNDIQNYEMERDTETGDNIRKMMDGDNIDIVDDFIPDIDDIVNEAIEEEKNVATPKRQVFSATNNRIIAVGALYQGAGATTLAVNLARAFAQRGISTSYVEFPLLKPYMFDYLAIHNNEKLQNTEYFDAAREVAKGRPIKRNAPVWKAFDINWFVNDSRFSPIDKFTCDDMLKFVYSVNSAVTIVDFSAHLSNPEVQEFLYHVDDIYVCIDSNHIKVDWMSEIADAPENMQREERKVINFLTDLENKEGLDYKLVSMKHTNVIDNKYIWGCLEKEPISLFPIISHEVLVELAWKSKFLYDSPEYRAKMEDVFKPIIINSLPKEYHELKKEKKGLLKGLFGGKK